MSRPINVDAGIGTARSPELSVALAEAFGDDPVMSWLVPAFARVFGRRLPHVLALLSALERRHPRRPHHYLAYVGVVPGAQGLGVGTRMLEAVLDRCDRERSPVYLEASSPRNAELYRRMGFEGIEVITPFGAPPLELMIREPRP